jgi:Fibronectin type III domain
MQRYRCFFMARATRLLVLLAVACLVAAPHSSSAAAVPDQDADRVPERPFELKTINITDTRWVASWKIGAVASPAESYTLACVQRGDGCFAAALAQVTDIPRARGNATVTGLKAGSFVTCYVIAVNSFARVCSQGVNVDLGGAPGTPTDLTTVNVTTTSWTASWVDGSASMPAETYLLRCSPRGQGCNATTVEGTAAVDIRRGVGVGRVTNLIPGSNFTCYVIAANINGARCSTGVDVSTPRVPDAPSGLATLNYTAKSWTATWVDGTPGVPVETYTLKCVASGAICRAAPLAQVERIERGTQIATVTGLKFGTLYTCYVIAANGIGTRCSLGLNVTVGTSPGRPTNVATGSIDTNSWTPQFTVSLNPAVPEETYSVKCVARGDACTDTAVVLLPGFTRANALAGNFNTAKVSQLTPGTRYTCYVIAVNSIGSVCSSAVQITTWRPPGQPTQLTSVTLSPTTWTASWADAGIVGIPPENYTLKCVGSGKACNASPLAQVERIERGTQTGTLTGMTVGTPYTCYVVAVNEGGTACSSMLNILILDGTSQRRPTNVATGSIDTNSWTPQFTVSLNPAVPEETYSVKCVASGGACRDTAVASREGFTRASALAGNFTTAKVSQLTPGTQYTCYVIAVNSIGSWCSSAVNITTWRPPGQPTNLTTVGVDFQSLLSANWTASWTDAAIAGVPAETYMLKCVDRGGSCSDPAVAQSPNITRGVRTGSVSGLTPGKQYTCYLTVTGYSTELCSLSIAADVTTSPGSSPHTVLPGALRL